MEATDRFGGRVNSKHFGDAFCELGARWITIDGSKYSTYELVRQATGLQKKIHQKSDKTFINSKGEKVNQKFPELVDKLFNKVCSGIELEKKYKAGALHDLNNVNSYFQAESDKMIKSKFRTSEQNLASDVFSIFIKEFSSLMGCCLEYVNIEHITKIPLTTSNPIYIPNGMDNILSHITNNIDTRSVKVGKPVGLIQWFESSQHHKKIVGCMDGSAFSADHIICTLPLGVLKNFSKFMFKPTLPKEKLKSIKKLGFGNPLKVYFEYEENIESWFSRNMRLVWSLQERTSDLKWTKQIIEISKIPTSKRVLEIIIGGAFYEHIEKLPDGELLDEVTKVLKKYLKNQSIPYPASALRSNWSSSACFFGGKPYFSTGSSVTDVKTLATPLGETPALLFAGDATILEGFGSIDGARKSGIREAQRIIDFYSTNQMI